MNLVGLAFFETFAFSRAIAAPVRRSNRVVEMAPPDQPRLDYDAGGHALGLLVEPGATLGQADRCAVVAGDWESLKATVLHEYATPDGNIVQRAFYTENPKAMADAALRVEGHHRLIGVVPVFLRNLGGYVVFRQRKWVLAGGLGTGVADQQLEDGSDLERPLVEA